MREMADVPTRGLQLLWFEETPGAFYAGGGGQPPKLEEALTRVAKIEKEYAVTIHLLDAKAVCGPAHLASALMHARRAKERGRARARDAKVELMTYLVGNRQIARAIEKAGISQKSTGVAMAIEGAAQPAYDAQVALLHALDLSRSDDVLAPTAAKAKALGVAGAAADDEGWEALAVEVVAALDLD